MKIELIKNVDATEIAKLAVCLTNEIMERTGKKHFNVDINLAICLCKSFLQNGQYNVIAAYDGESIVGFAALCESHSLYAEGSFGIVQEFYVLPEYRSRKIGTKIIHKIKSFAESKKWKRLELCTPPLPEFEKTVNFYQENGFEITGGYKMKLSL